MPIERLRPSFSFDGERIKELKKIAPEAFADGKINWETLKEALGEYLEDESGEVEHFGLFWPGKKEARKIASIPSKGTLVPEYGEGLKADGTPDIDGVNDSSNIFIEGENLEVLKILQKSYAGRIKMIYIDPPYNTGNDFIYDDNFTEPLEEYLKRTGQIDGEGKPITTNKRTDGRFHSKWFSMMYPRLRLARNLLKDDGVIFVSIDDNEVHHLQSMMNEIFGEENFLSKITIITGANQAGEGVKFQKNTEYCIVYSKNGDTDCIDRVDKVNESLRSLNDAPTPLETREEMGYTIYYHPIEKDIIPLKDYDKAKIPTNKINEVYQSNSDLIKKGYIPIRPGFRNNKLHRWRWGIDTFKERIKEIVINEKNGEYKVAFKQEGKNPPKNYFNFSGGAPELKELFNNEIIFDYPKSYKYLKYLISIGCNDEGIILDFFSGSGTTSHALLELNKEDGVNRQFILVQMPEPCNEKSDAFKAGYRNIAQIGKERIRRVVKRFKETTPTDKLTNQDLGFKSLKLSNSNFKDWFSTQDNNISKLQELFDKHLSSVIEGSNVESLLIEIMLLEGFPLDARINRNPEFKSNEVELISSELNDHKLIVCLDERINIDTINKLTLGEKDIFICLDTAISDQEKLRLSDKGYIKTI